MRFTRVGLLLLATGWSCFPLALATGTLAPALLGALLVALVVTRPAPTARLTVTREAPERVIAGAEATVVTRVVDEGGDAPLFIEPEAPAGTTVISSTLQAYRGRAERVTRFTAASPGAVQWPPARVRYQDAWGLVEDAAALPAPTGVLRVAPEPALAKTGERAGRGRTMGGRVREPTGADWEPEVERLRDYAPGDRFRDIDWAHSTKLQTLVTRELRREAPRPVVVLLDATQTMRRQRRVPKLATASRAALAIASAAHATRVPVGFVAWSERGVEALVRATTSRRAVREATDRVSALPPATRAERPPLPRAFTSDAVTRRLAPSERAFLAASSPLSGARGTGTTPLEGALAAVSRATSVPSFIIAFVDAEENPVLVRTLLSRFARSGHRVLVVAPATGPHHYSRADARDETVLARLVAWQRNRRHAERFAETQRADFLALGPHLTRDALEEVVRSAR